MRPIDTAAAPPRFDVGRNAWLLSRFDDVSAALREPSLVAFGTTEAQSTVHESVRDDAARALAPSHAAVWQNALASRADLLLRALPDHVPVDLMGDVFAPWSRYAAVLVCAVPDECADECASLARTIWQVAATATDGAPRDDAERSDQSAAAFALAELLARVRGTNLAVADVQTFVALSETVPCVLSGSWHALLRQPRCVSQLRASPGDMKAMMSEALRCASPSRAVFRVALRDVAIADIAILAGQQVVLSLASANHDPARFYEAGTIDPTRAESGHLVFGDGMHRCAGASFVRSLLCSVTVALLRRAQRIELAELPESPSRWRGGFAIGAPDALFVTLTH